MFDFMATPHLLRITLWVVKETMHFHIAQTGLYFRTTFIFALMGPSKPGFIDFT